MTAQSALYYTVKVAGGGPSVQACAVFLRAESRDGDKLGQTPYNHTGLPLRRDVMKLINKGHTRTKIRVTKVLTQLIESVILTRVSIVSS